MLVIDIHPPVARVTLDRPEVHNAFNGELIGRITSAFRELAGRDDIRAIVLAGRGPSFCAGGDLGWMQGMIDRTFEENAADARAMADMYVAIASCPKPVIARVHGAALGGGAGLAAAADIAVAVESADFGFTEVRWGLVPGVISVFVLDRIGPGRAREHFVTGERFPAADARAIGLIHAVVPDEAALDRAIEEKIAQILKAAPGAIAETKTLIAAVDALPPATALQYAVEALARARTGDEGQAGMKAFLARRKPPWSL